MTDVVDVGVVVPDDIRIDVTDPQNPASPAMQSTPSSFHRSIPKTEKRLPVKNPEEIDLEENVSHKEVASKTYDNLIVNRLLKPYYYHEISNSIKWQVRWQKLYTCCVTSAMIFVLLSTLLTSCSLYFTSAQNILTILGIIFNTSSISIQQFANYCKTCSKKKRIVVNKFMKQLGINDMIPDITDDDIGELKKQL